jgi:hypothetical protein
VAKYTDPVWFQEISYFTTIQMTPREAGAISLQEPISKDLPGTCMFWEPIKLGKCIKFFNHVDGEAGTKRGVQKRILIILVDFPMINKV